MSAPWAIIIAQEDAASVAALRLRKGVEIAEAGEHIWLRGRDADDSLIQALRGLPASARYEWLADNRLRALEARIPAAAFPPLTWRPLQSWIDVELPPSAFPAENPRPVPVRLIRSTEEQTANLIFTDWSELIHYAEQAPEVRLNRLAFAVNASGEVLVRGEPLPPIVGRRYVIQDGIAVPAGYAWTPRVSATVVARCFGVSSDNLILWHEGGTFERVHGELFVAATRSAIRATAQAEESCA